MFQHLAEILKSFSPAQRILALLILVSTIAVISLGPTLIKENTQDCKDLTLQIESQTRQIESLTQRVEELNREILASQDECTDNLIQKQAQIASLIDGIINETQQQARLAKAGPEPRYLEEMEDPNGQKVSMMIIPQEPQPDPSESYQKMLTKLNRLKKQVDKTWSPAKQ
jgi:cell division protein FtsB